MSIAVPHPSQEGCVALFIRRYFVRVYGSTSSEYTVVLRPGPWWINAAMQILNHCFTFGREASRLH
ncbi:hypothetical protein J8L08_15980 [Bacteroides fragilis]|uniref:hypothetical protein n=1 Tax=Bacteroides TaxID=816 RepID=UPI0010CAA846|nr:hypothetical protein [Bacteroides fragilis]MCE8574707.1 hypothetical protein [Bacteroides fragilis]MCE8613012.1 hypothetical protein [Bacteroides fragilis]MCM0277127.1 hypothetical protein [Bacteroides fragilis]QCQ30625.1 hypothetical protein IB64_002650 [Bacteroides fragilis]UHZ83587.1 hypothetical protein K0E66_02570 [Bacteroides fragilis]